MERNPSSPALRSAPRSRAAPGLRLAPSSHGRICPAQGPVDVQDVRPSSRADRHRAGVRLSGRRDRLRGPGLDGLDLALQRMIQQAEENEGVRRAAADSGRRAIAAQKTVAESEAKLKPLEAQLDPLSSGPNEINSAQKIYEDSIRAVAAARQRGARRCNSSSNSWRRRGEVARRPARPIRRGGREKITSGRGQLVAGKGRAAQARHGGEPDEVGKRGG